jgi:uncharacterized membrane protein YeaQ/YmgE (transglycosylase-associated protein family)
MVPMLLLLVLGGLVGWIAAILQLGPRSTRLTFVCICVGAASGVLGGLITAGFDRAALYDYNAQINGLLLGICIAVTLIAAILARNRNKHSE